MPVSQRPQPDEATLDERCRDDDPPAWRNDPDVLRARFLRGFRRGVKKAIRDHHIAGHSVFVSRGDRDGWLMPDGTLVEGDEPPEQEVEVTIRMLEPKTGVA